MQKAQRIQLAQHGFISKWGKKTKAMGDWARLAKYAYIMENKAYKPFEELDDLMGRVWQIGTVKVQHLRDVKILDDPTVIQELYISIKMADQKVRLEGIGRLLARWTLARMAGQYKATVHAVTLAADQGRIKMTGGHTARAEAKSYILKTMYLTEKEIARKRHFDDNPGILTQLPEDQTEVALRYHIRWPPMFEIIDLLRPDRRKGPRL
ncbi:MAG: hypothetical protein Q9208_004778 [Pyrenodesmia sp. 3 TL-2023]